MQDHQVIEQTILHLFEGADERDWSKVENTMADVVLLDYTSMTGGEPLHLSPRQITASWASFLPGFDKTNHKISSFAITVDHDTSVVTYTGKADHFIDDRVWTVEGTYETTLVYTGGNWRINKLKFTLSGQSGDTDLPSKATERIQTRAHS
ncbi:nuclear transport factor 2 family protein [Hymenobacter chitinivorans]|uniref:SnoaL-like protein n=1 Tax=Hymenobacter chitinivorans DSM 11115 TaxID=1121954 RepID=A0A2M9BT88_9BACT|nr:nuclear transport factor 2 family protein [Hymenobacter chitinivorans]PJJ61169.1 SnoaL-like protein [Hymenobacter chitinivorans DSM 11115]